MSVGLIGKVSVEPSINTASVPGAKISLKVNGEEFVFSVEHKDISLWGNISNGRVTLNLGPSRIIFETLENAGVCGVTNHGDRFRYVWKAVVRAVEAEISKNLT